MKRQSSPVVPDRPSSSPSQGMDEPPKFASPACAMAEFSEWALPSSAAPAPHIALKRAYETPAPEDGSRFLVDRLWPRGVKKESLQLAAWLKDVAPSTLLRQWFAHQPSRWIEFRERYRRELQNQDSALTPLREAMTRGPLTLIYAARDDKHNHAVVLREYLLTPLNRS